MKHLLEKWATLEPTLCKRETRPNKDWHEEFEDYWIQTELGWQMVYTDMVAIGYGEVKKEAPAKIQWAVQQAIIEKKWYFCILYNKELYQIEMGSEQPSPRFMRGENLVEALLSAYLAELEASANP